jgi:hypothetical protein
MFMGYPLITLPANFVASTTQVMSQLFTDLSGPIILILGVVIGALVIEIIFSIIRPH